jgi:hypothetical protein
MSARRTPVAGSPAMPRGTLIGVPAPVLGQTARVAVPQPGPSGPPPGLAGVRKSNRNLPLPNLGNMSVGGSMPPPPSPAPQPVFTFDSQANRQPGYNQGVFGTRVGPAPRTGLYAVLGVLALVILGGGAYWYYWTVNKPGKVQLATSPGDATVLLDNVKVGDHSPVVFEKAPGPYTLSVTRDGYVRNDQNIEIRAGQPLALTVTLEPSPDTGFELTSDPPGGLVWLDGAPISGPN